MADPIDTITGQVLDMASELRDSQEAYVREVWIASGLTLEEFAREYVIEEYPIEHTTDPETNTYGISQTIVCRRKTDEEKQQELLALADDIGEKIARGELPPQDENGFYKI